MTWAALLLWVKRHPVLLALVLSGLAVSVGVWRGIAQYRADVAAAEVRGAARVHEAAQATIAQILADSMAVAALRLERAEQARDSALARAARRVTRFTAAVAALPPAIQQDTAVRELVASGLELQVTVTEVQQSNDSVVVALRHELRLTKDALHLMAVRNDGLRLANIALAKRPSRMDQVVTGLISMGVGYGVGRYVQAPQTRTVAGALR